MRSRFALHLYGCRHATRVKTCSSVTRYHSAPLHTFSPCHVKAVKSIGVMSCVERRWTSRGSRHIARASVPKVPPATSAFAVILRTSGLTTRRLTPCTRAYFDLLQHELHGVSSLHVLTDMSLWAPAHLATPRELRQHADAHEGWLRAELPGIQPFAFTVADIIEQWPGVKWPLPGDESFHAPAEYDIGIRIWLGYVHRTLGMHGNLTRSLELPSGRSRSSVPGGRSLNRSDGFRRHVQFQI